MRAGISTSRIRIARESAGLGRTQGSSPPWRAIASPGTRATGASLNQPAGVALDASGNLYIADKVNNRIRKVAAATGIITTVAGNGISGFAGDGGAATSASLGYPAAVALDASGNLYILDQY